MFYNDEGLLTWMFNLFFPHKCDELLIQPWTQIHKHAHTHQKPLIYCTNERVTHNESVPNSGRVDRIVQPLGIYYIII